MAIRTYDILLDSYNSTMPEPIVGRQGDKNGAVTLHVTITDRGAAVDLTGQTVNLIAEIANGTAVVADNGGVTLTDAPNGKFDYAIPNALWSESGKITKAYFSLNDTDGQQTTYDLIFIVKKAIDISQEKADDYITVIDGTIRDLKTKSDDYIAVIDGTVRDLQSKVDAIYATYQAGDFYSKAQTDEKDAATLASAKSYADTQDTSTLASAKSYADTQDTSTLASAKSYADIAGYVAPQTASTSQVQQDPDSPIEFWREGHTVFLQGGGIFPKTYSGSVWNIPLGFRPSKTQRISIQAQHAYYSILILEFNKYGQTTIVYCSDDPKWTWFTGISWHTDDPMPS